VNRAGAPTDEGGGIRVGWAYLLAGPFLLLAPLTTFIAHAGYPFDAPEVPLCMLAASSVGLALGGILTIAPAWLRTLLAVGMVSFVIDVQSGWFAALGLRRALLIIYPLGAVLWLMRDQLGQRLLAIVSGVLCLTSFLVPASATWRLEGAATNGAADRAPFVQIILDEHIGIEGIPQDFDPGGGFAASIRETLEQRGFTVFTRAYSRYFDTRRSIPAALNFSAPGVVTPFVEDANREPAQMRANATISLLRERGYQVHVVQTEFLDLCHVSGQSIVEECATYTLNTIASIRNLPVGAWTKAGMILDMFVHRSELDRRLRRALGWPEPRRVSAVSTMQASDSIVSMLRRTRPGDAYLIHLMLPHYPYAFDSECRMRPDPSRWLDGSDPAAAPRQNTSDSRRVRYPLYLEQLHCTQKLVSHMLDALVEAGVYDQSIVLIHGDHGSRITTVPPEPPFLDELRPQDYVDAFSTLFVAKLPGVSGGTDRRVLPLEDLVAAVVRDERLPQRATSEPPWVWVYAGSERLEQRPLPSFSHGHLGEVPSD